MEERIGYVEGFFSKISVAAIKIEGNLSVGDTIKIKGATTDFTMKVESMQINRQEVNQAKAGDEVGIKVPEKVRHGDIVFKVEE